MATDLARKPKLKLVDLNPHLSCILCGGYFIDATTITECLHSFCRACIVRYLETSKYCPVCEVQVHKTRPLRCIRSDKILQDIVYKLVPGLYSNEMKRRRELYASQPPEALQESRDAEDRGEGMEDRYIYTPDEIFSVTLRHQCDTSVEEKSSTLVEKDENIPKRRFLRCPAGISVNHLKKFIRVKFAVPKSLQIVLQFEDKVLENDYSLMDVAYISAWKWNGPLELTFRVTERPKIVPKLSLVYNVEVGAEVEDSGIETQPTDSLVETTDPCSTVQEDVPESKESDDQFPIDGNSRGIREETVPNYDTVGESLELNNPSPNTEQKETAKSSHESSGNVLSADENGSNKAEENGDIDCPDVPMRSLSTGSTAASVPSMGQGSTESAESSETSPKIESEEPVIEEPSPPKVPKLTIPLTPKILQMAAQHAEDDRMDLDSDLFEGPLVIAEPEVSSKEYEDDCSNSKDSSKLIGLGDFEEAKKDREIIDDYDVDSGRGSDSSSRAEARSLCGDEDIGSPASSTVRTPDLEKPSAFAIPSPPSMPSPTKGGSLEDTGDKAKVGGGGGGGVPTPPTPEKSDFGVLDLSTCRRKRDEDGVPLSRPKQIANPPVLDKFRQTTPCLPLPSHPSFKLFPPVIPHTSMYKKPDYSRGNFRYSRGSTLTVINPDPNSCRPKIVIKNLDPRPEHRHHHHHHHHHHSHHHQKM